MNNSPLDLLLQRRSAAALSGPALTSEQIDCLIQAAATVPDHKRLRPYRFVVIEETGREQFALALINALEAVRGSLSAELQEKIRAKTQAAPTQVLIIFSPDPNANVPEWEQRVAASCTGYAIQLAAVAQGLGANWRTSPALAGEALTELFELAPQEQIIGWINLGQVVSYPANPRPRVETADLLSVVK